MIGNDSMETGDGNAIGTEALETSSGLVAHDDVDRTPNGLLNSSTMPSQGEGSVISSGPDSQSSCHAPLVSGGDQAASVPESNDVDMNVTDVDMNVSDVEREQTGPGLPLPGINLEDSTEQQNGLVVQEAGQADESSLNNETSNANGIDPTFLEALPEDLRAEVLASQQAQSAPAPTYAPPRVEDIDPEFLAALPPDIQAEVLAQQRAQRIAQQSEGQPVDMDNASIIATFPADLREEVCVLNSTHHDLA